MMQAAIGHAVGESHMVCCDQMARCIRDPVVIQRDDERLTRSRPITGSAGYRGRGEQPPGTADSTFRSSRSSRLHPATTVSAEQDGTDIPVCADRQECLSYLG